MSDSENLILQDPTLIKSAPQTDGEKEEGAHGPPTVAVPDGRDYKAQVEETEDEQVVSTDAVEPPKVDQLPHYSNIQDYLKILNPNILNNV